MIRIIHNKEDLVDYDILCNLFIDIFNEEGGNDNEEDEHSVS